MSAYDNSFLRKSIVGGVTTSLLVHENPDEAIQGGAVGDHYHVTAAQVALVDSIPDILDEIHEDEADIAYLLSLDHTEREPMMMASAIVLTVDGDIVMGAV